MLLIGVVLLLCLSAFFSGTETAMMALDRYQVRSQASEGHVQAGYIIQYLDQPERFFSVVLLGNTFANLAATSLYTLWLMTLPDDWLVFVATIIFPVVVLFFCEFWPKSVACQYPSAISFRVVHFLRGVEFLFYPIIRLMQFVVSGFNQAVPQQDLTSSELKRVIQVAGSHLPKEEQAMLSGVVDLGQLFVESVMCPKHAVAVLDLSSPISEILLFIRQSQAHYLLVVSDSSWSSIEGALFLKDLAFYPEQQDIEGIRKHLRSVGYVQEGTRLNTQLRNFKRKGVEVSVVVDEYGEPLGVIDVHDIVEEVVGYYANRSAIPIGSVRFDGEFGYWTRPDVVVRDLNKYLEWTLPEHTATTIGGLVFATLGEIPDGVCAFRVDGYVVSVIDVKNNRLRLLHIYSIIEKNNEGEK